MDYHLKPVGKICAACEQPLQAGEQVHSVVIERHGEFERRDISDACWNGPPEGMLAHWVCSVPEPEQKRTSAVDPDAMLAFFEQLVEDGNPAQDKLKYVLALFLLQQRRLRLEGSVAGETGELLQLSGSRGEGPFEIRDQQLAEEEITRLQSELSQCLEQEWNAA